MLPIKQILFWPKIVGQALWAIPDEEDSLLKKTAIFAYNILPLSAVLATIVVGIAAFILGGLFNLAALLLIEPLRTISLWYSLRDAIPKTFEQPPPTGAGSMSLGHYVHSAEFPVILHRKNTPNPQPTAPKITFFWPSKNNQGANSLFLDFLNEKITIPRTSHSVWGLFSTAGSEEGASYWNKNAHLLVPFLFPSKNPSPVLNPNAPVLTANIFSALHEEASKDLRGKYIFTLLMCLQFWGISLDSNLNFQTSNQFDIQSIRDNPHRILLFQQIITSLVECGFASLAVKLVDFINKHKHMYNLSEDIFQELFQTLLAQENHILDATEASKEEAEEFFLFDTDYTSIWYRKTYVRACASSGPYDENAFLVCVTFLHTALAQSEDEQKPFSRENLDVLFPQATCLDPYYQEKDRPTLELAAPIYFCSPAVEKTITSPALSL